MYGRDEAIALRNVVGNVVDFQPKLQAEALRQAQLALLRGEVRIEGGELVGNGIRIPLPPELQGWENRDLSHPYYWAGFTLVGSPW